MSFWRIICFWGARDQEVSGAWPCDDLAEPGDVSYFRAVDVAADPECVYRWLCQLKVAPYSYDLLDNGGRRSPRQLSPGAEHLAVGQRVMSIFKLVSFVPDRSMTLRSRGSRWLGEVRVTYQTLPAGEGTRLIARLRVNYAAHPIGWIARVALPFGDWIMMRKQLLTLKELAEANARARRVVPG